MVLVEERGVVPVFRVGVSSWFYGDAVVDLRGGRIVNRIDCMVAARGP
jgi:hypothetical protein